MYGCCVRRHNRQIHKTNILKGGKLKRNQTPHLVFGFAINDVVEYDNRLWFVTGRRESGYFKITDIATKENMDSISYKKLKFKRHLKSNLQKLKGTPLPKARLKTSHFPRLFYYETK